MAALRRPAVFGPEAALNRLFAHNNARKRWGSRPSASHLFNSVFVQPTKAHALAVIIAVLRKAITSFFSSRVASSSRTGGARDANSLMAAPLARAPSKSSSNFMAARSFSSCCRLSCSAASAAAHFACSFFAFLTSPSHGARLFNTNPQGKRQALEDSFAISGLAAK